MRTLPLLVLLAATLAACADSPLREIRQPCTIDAVGQATAMDNIAAALEVNPWVNAGDYIQEPFEPFAVYNGSEHCDFVLHPWRAVHTEVMWDGSLGVRINKQTLEVEDIYRIDEK